APDPAVRAALLGAMAQVARQNGLSSVHVTFCTGAEAQEARALGWLTRLTMQYHWLNRGYGNFDDFLAALSSRKRKAIRKERARA
ncbi:peptidogalycan biosysnthesis protein, partial [Bacillus cereus group sp. BC232]|uniref:peptidogalycan biosysnthesis protein n=1 Tax=Bacillus cereus group sp. BC232 TaxID=3445338 RepID=UPI003F23B368